MISESRLYKLLNDIAKSTWKNETTGLINLIMIKHDEAEEELELTREERDAYRMAAEQLRAQVDKLLSDAYEEHRQFEDGMKAFSAGVPIENEPSYEHDHDVWKMGWLWQQYVYYEFIVPGLQPLQKAPEAHDE
jgi:hypothetical protein